MMLQVAVTGAGGRTGSLTVKRLLAESDKFSVIAIVRSEQVNAHACLPIWFAHLPITSAAGLCSCHCCCCRSGGVLDVSRLSPQSASEKLGDLPKEAVAVVDVASDAAADALGRAFGGAQALVIATSGVPKMKGPPKEGQPPQFYYEQMPEQVDWLGQKTQIDAAKQAGIRKVGSGHAVM